MKINLDLHSLFRTIIPASVVAAVFYSHHVFLGSEWLSDEMGGGHGFLILYGAGVIIYGVYRSIFVLVIQPKNEKEDAERVKSYLSSAHIDSIKEKCDASDSFYSLLLELYLNLKKNSDLKERIHFLISAAHSFGGSCLGVVLSIIFLSSKNFNFFWVAFWVVVAMCLGVCSFCYHRFYQATLGGFLFSRREDFIAFVILGREQQKSEDF